MFRFPNQHLAVDDWGVANRARATTCDSIVSSESSSTYDGNRSRANTNDSFSSSDNSASVQLGPDGKPLQGVRRRSHRPRGCRGGRKNRKNKERVRAQSNITMQELPVASGGYKHAVPVTFTAKDEPKVQLPPGFSMSQGNCPSPSTALMPPPPPVMFRDSSAFASFKPRDDRSVTASSASSLTLPETLSGDILPPAPMMIQENTPAIISGPNPYALSAMSVHRTPSHVPMNQDNLPSIATCISLEDDSWSSTLFSGVISQAPSMEFSEQDSLFATSPRSFLMGASRSSS